MVFDASFFLSIKNPCLYSNRDSFFLIPSLYWIKKCRSTACNRIANMRFDKNSKYRFESWTEIWLHLYMLTCVHSQYVHLSLILICIMIWTIRKCFIGKEMDWEVYKSRIEGHTIILLFLIYPTISRVIYKCLLELRLKMYGRVLLLTFLKIF